MQLMICHRDSEPKIERITEICWIYWALSRPMRPLSWSTKRNFRIPCFLKLWETQRRETPAKHACETTMLSSKLLYWYLSQSLQCPSSNTVTGITSPTVKNTIQDKTRLRVEDWLKPRRVRKVSSHWRVWPRSSSSSSTTPERGCCCSWSWFESSNGVSGGWSLDIREWISLQKKFTARGNIGASWWRFRSHLKSPAWWSLGLDRRL